MSRFNLWVSFMTTVGLAGQGWAASVGLPTANSENRVEITADYSRVFDRDMKPDPGESDEIKSGNQVFGRLGLAVADWLQLYAKGGVASYDEDRKNFNISGVGIRDVSFGYDLGPVWGGGLTGIYFFGDEKDWFIGYDGQWLHGLNDLDSVTHSGEAGTLIGGDIVVDEAHGALFLGQEVEMGDSRLAFYIGGRYSLFEIDVQRDFNYTTVTDGTVSVTGKAQADDRIGFFLGLRWRYPSRWSLAVELRLVDESAATGRASFAF